MFQRLFQYRQSSIAAIIGMDESAWLTQLLWQVLEKLPSKRFSCIFQEKFTPLQKYLLSIGKHINASK